MTGGKTTKKGFRTFEAVDELKGQKGFTLIELLIVVAIIGVLLTIAVPAFLSQRERARYRAVEASARSAVSEVQVALDGYQNRLAMVFLTEPGTETCFQHTAAAQPQSSCSSLYPGLPTQAYTTLSDVMAALETHYNIGKREKSPYSSADLVYYVGACSGIDPSAPEQQGRVVICNSSERMSKILGFSDNGVIIYNSIASAK